MSDFLAIEPLARGATATVQPPGSKSITNRALACAALAQGTSTLRGALVSEDTAVMIQALQQLGIPVQLQGAGETLVVTGCGGCPPATTAEMWVGNSGTTMRFLTALATLGRGKYRLDGIARMRQRPLGDLAIALNQLGAEVRCVGAGACPPVEITARGLAGGTAHVGGQISSQFLSGLLLAAPYAERDVTVQVQGQLVSIPYVEMTLAVMAAFGVPAVAQPGCQTIQVPTGRGYRACDYSIEPDASAASYFWAAAAVTQGTVQVTGLSPQSLQGDVAFVDCLAAMGCDVTHSAAGITVTGGTLHGIDVDMNAISDTVQTLAVVSLFAQGPTRIRNVAHIRHKETDRLAALAAELRKLGAEVQETASALEIHPGKFRPARIETYNDHRMAMSFAVAGLAAPGVVIQDPGCTAKTYPKFFEDLSQVFAG